MASASAQMLFGFFFFLLAKLLTHIRFYQISAVIPFPSPSLPLPFPPLRPNVPNIASARVAVTTLPCSPFPADKRTKTARKTCAVVALNDNYVTLSCHWRSHKFAFAPPFARRRFPFFGAVRLRLTIRRVGNNLCSLPSSPGLKPTRGQSGVRL